MNALEGGCACGAVRYRLKSGPMFVHCCHCGDCQRQVGSAFVINALIETDRIEVLSGEFKATAMPTDSGRPHLVYRCTACGTTLWSDYGDRKVMSFLRATTLDDATDITGELSAAAQHPAGGCDVSFPMFLEVLSVSKARVRRPRQNLRANESAAYVRQPR